MLSKSLKESYFHNSHKVIIPKPAANVDADLQHEMNSEDSRKHNEPNTAMAATVAANFASIGFVMTKELVEKLAKANKQEIEEFYYTYVKCIKDVMGSEWDYEPFYPNFPEEVIQKDRLEIFLDQVLYAMSGLILKPTVYEKAKETFPFMGEGQTKAILEGSEEDYLDIMHMIITSQRAWTPEQRRQVLTFVKEYEDVSSVIPDADEMNNHENTIAFVTILEDTGHSGSAQYIRTVTDVLRYAAVRSAQEDVLKGKGTISEISLYAYQKTLKDKEPANNTYNSLYHYASLRFDKKSRPSFKFPRSMRRRIIWMLENQGTADWIAAEMMQKKAIWKCFIRNAHISEIAGCAKSKEAFKKISTNAVIDRPSRRIEEAIKKNDLAKVLEELKGRPGDMSRRFDKLLRMGIELGQADKVMETFAGFAEKAGINTILGLVGLMKKRTKPETERIFQAPTATAPHVEEGKNREPLSQEMADRVITVCKESMAKRFAGKEAFGKVYISPEMKDYFIPTDMREASEGLHSYTPGSRVSLHTDKPWLRMFCSWTNMEKSDGSYIGRRVDNDLAAMLYNNNGERVDISWNAAYYDETHIGEGVKNQLYIYSGDVQDGGPADGNGVAEFIDLNLPLLKKEGYRYAVMNVSSYTGQPFAQQPNTFFGFMMRDPDEAGKTFEPSTVQERYKMCGKATHEVACIFDIQEDKMIWLDRPLMRRVMTSARNEIEVIISQAENMSVFTFDDLIRINLKARGGAETDSLEEANTIFVGQREFSLFLRENPDYSMEGKKIIFPYDIAYIAGELMQDGPGDTGEGNKGETEVPDENEKTQD